MTQENYIPRLIDATITRKLKSVGALLIEGPKWCGKTTTSEHFANSVLYFDEPLTFERNIQLADTDVYQLLEGVSPHLIDEWQWAPKIWDAIRFTVDHQHGAGQFILTGSAVPADHSKMHHTGTGRYAWITMRPMSLWESGESSGEVSLADLFDGKRPVRGTNKWKLSDIAYLICRGGWPETLFKDKEAALDVAFDYIKAVSERDISRVDDVKRSAKTTRKLLRSYARLQGSQAGFTTIATDMSVNKDPLVSESTISRYLEALRKIFVIEDLPAWSPNLRSATVIRSSDTRYMVDPSLAAASMSVSPEKLMKDLNTLGLLFETLCIRDLRVYADTLNGEVSHYRDKDGLECDAVFEMNDGRYGLIEIKLGGDNAIYAAQNSLKTLADKIDTTKIGEPSFRMVLTAVGDMAYSLKDGTLVVPIGCLKP